ncbi:BTAD domain-containing putative transcriptional regulator [Geodermatophilus sp. SYSU D00742]
MTVLPSEAWVPANAIATGCVLHLLGDQPYVSAEGRRYEVPEGGKRLLVFLALNRRRVERRRVAGALWPVGSEERAAGNLRSALWRLRGADIGVLLADKTSVKLREEVTVDFELVSAWATRLIDGSMPTQDLALSPYWTEALDLLPGWYEDWVLMERERLRQRVLHALEALSHRLLVAGRCAEAVDVAVTAVAVEPLRESAQRALLAAHLAEGNRIEALRCLTAYRTLVRRELGVEPAADLFAMARLGDGKVRRPPLPQPDDSAPWSGGDPRDQSVRRLTDRARSATA